MSPKILGRARVLKNLASLLDEGKTVLLWGPVGVGKTTVLQALERRARARGTPCGVAARTEHLADLTAALAQAYPEVDHSSGTAARVRSRLRIAVEERPGLVLLDHLRSTGTAFKGMLRSIGGTGVGVLLVGDADQPRDHQRLRSLHLAYTEIELAPLHRGSMRVLLRGLLVERALPHRLSEDDFCALIADAAGLPGRAVWFAQLLTDPSAWREGRVRRGWLRAEAIIQATETYMRAVQ